ncbi:Hsp20/alpha crystallin family protein [Moorella naiadis]|uniref:Hsp20/alpha crystallin family protein n=1 Tax=Moorella naiadis (nom. illeg.) TaxID=3093670 RepID=UPI003D9C9B42
MAIERYRGGLTPWNPFRELEELRERILDLASPLFPLSRRPVAGEGGAWAPPIEVYEEKDKYVIKADLPGLNKEDIDVAVSKNVLTIKGERKAEKECQEKDYYYCERYYGNFLRSISLPGSVDAAKIVATYKDGILSLELPKAEEEKEKKIDIKVE